MASHIKSVASSGLPLVPQAEFLSRALSGDLVFCWGQEAISHAIENETDGPSHVLQLWQPTGYQKWLTLESTIDKGVHVGQFSEYIGGYNGDMVLCRRTLTTDEIRAIQDRFFSILDDNYDWKSEVGQAAHKLLSFLPVEVPKQEYYCSGSQYYASLAVPPGLQRPNPEWLPTPEDNFTDPSVIAICGILKGAK